MRWFSHRARIFLLSVIALLVMAVLGIFLVRAINPEFNILSRLGMGDDETPSLVRTRPYWAELTEKQKEMLTPLEVSWEHISSARKQKWLEIAEQMQQMTPDQVGHIHNRMRLWVTLTPEQRREARSNFMSTRGVKDKTLQWLEYQNLPEEEKRALVASARKKRRLPDPPIAAKAEPEVLEPETVEPEVEEKPEYWN